ncbi:MAG: DNA-directed RNA polymerase, subunit E'' [archaeon GB-1867-097]|nr:DNA-directed RNA polymerase, subunit E'' [Candidatus Verstraetearchaeota archaeon]MCS7373491.1 DNA-directed RNA polymerase, subunit E'' [Candidatus Culexmicrobium thermophilum]MCS7384250.1 DNA-directed RNA polymerase, subunit E'' [Candidatus Culexmicrobium thermophilum]RLE55550.1 MAG: DNA-binding protein [Candidatus Verstraetearchaeota archaeon]HDO19977.1 DNA-directed RNA polymerase, subunit E'' [Candidatus Bathyarchaeota archaeon]
MSRRGLPFKACRNCHLLVEEDVKICPQCGSKDFSDDWRGLVILLNINCETGRIMGKKEAGKYAIEVH